MILPARSARQFVICSLRHSEETAPWCPVRARIGLAPKRVAGVDHPTYVTIDCACKRGFNISPSVAPRRGRGYTFGNFGLLHG